MKAEILSFENLHEHGDLFVRFLKARKQAFIVQNNWDLPEAEGMEYDQYDTPASRWVVVHDDGKVLAGVRLTPTTAVCGIYTYMIRDAQRGLIKSIPPTLLDFKAPVDPNIWESSRIFVLQEVEAKQRRRVHALLMNGLVKAARSQDARVVIGLVPAIWARWIKRLGLNAEPAGPVLDLDGWQTQVAMMTLKPVAKSANLPPLSKPVRHSHVAAGANHRLVSLTGRLLQMMRLSSVPPSSAEPRKSMGA